jgi:predicted Fe-Mo cluster-binding NifX family protein
MKIAVPVEGENLTIVKRTGQAPFFALFNDAVFDKLVEAPQSGQDHHDHDGEHEHHHGDDEAHIEGHGKSLANLAGVDLMLVRMIGTHMKAAVDRAGIAVKKIREKHGERADEAVKNFLQGDKI